MNNEFNNQNMNQFQNNNMNNKNDNWKNVLIVILIFICLSLTALTIYVVVDRKDNINDNKGNVQEENKDNNVDGKDNNIQENESNEDENTINKEINLKNIECSGDENTCTKIFNMNYNDMQHEIKIIQSITYKNDGSPFMCFKEIQIFVDNKMIEKIENISSLTANNDFDGYAYVFDSKYLGILYPSSAADYVLRVYNNDVKIGEERIIWGSQGMYKDQEYKEQLNTLEKIEFDGNKLLYWAPGCYDDTTPFDKVSLSIKNNKINLQTVDHIKGYGSGATC